MGITATTKDASGSSLSYYARRVLRRRPRGVRGLAVQCAAVAAIATPCADAEVWKYNATVGVEETLTNNVNLQPVSTRRGDFVSQITPGFNFSGVGAHNTLTGQISLPILLYARTGSDNNRVLPQANIFGSTELVERFFFVEGSVNVSQQYLTPFGARPSSLATRTDNQYTSQVYRITPYIKGVADGDIRYELRDTNIWTAGNAAQINATYTNEVLGTVQRDPHPFGWGADYDRAETKFSDQQSLLTELVRAKALYQVDPQVQLSISGGYEHNDFLLTDETNAIYGAAFRWRPTERTNFDGTLEHRFFGRSYNVTFNHRTPLSTWNAYAVRNITTYPQQFAALSAGTDVQGALNQLLSSRIVDPAQRQAIVNQLIQDRGLPLLLTGPVNLYTQQITLQESLGGSLGLLGARNSVLVSVFRVRQQPITGAGNLLPDFLALLTDNTQYGGNVVWSTNLTPQVTFSASIDGSRTVSNAQQAGTTKQASVRATVITPLSRLTAVYAGLRYQVFRSSFGASELPFANNYDEVAVFVGLTHSFR